MPSSVRRPRATVERADAPVPSAATIGRGVKTRYAIRGRGVERICKFSGAANGASTPRPRADFGSSGRGGRGRVRPATDAPGLDPRSQRYYLLVTPEPPHTPPPYLLFTIEHPNK